jgi:hypothetical protein
MANVIGDTKDKRGGAVLVSGVQAVILGPYDLTRYPHKSFTIYNGGSVTLSGAVIQINPDHQGYEDSVPLSNPGSIGAAPNAGLWENFDTTSFQSLASGGIKTVFIDGKEARWWRIVGINHQPPSVMTSGWVYGNAI